MSVFTFKEKVSDLVGAGVAQVHDAASKESINCAKPRL
jgi:hypothetical protein